MSASPTFPTLSRVTPHIGAVVDGVELRADLPQAVIDWLDEALVEHKVLFVRGQEQLDQATHEAFAARFGNPQAHPTVPSADGRYSLAIESDGGQRADRWHADVTFIPNYPKLSILRAVDVPAVGGDTLWADQVTAYRTLPESLQRFVDGLRAVHTNLYDYAEPRHGSDQEAYGRYRRQFERTAWRTEHPLVRVHPVSGQRALVLGGFIERIVGVSREDSDQLIALLHRHVEQHERIVRWRWAPGDVALWDNRATLHRVVDDFEDGTRSLARVTLEGEVPVGVDGRPSELISRVGDDIPQPVAA